MVVLDLQESQLQGSLSDVPAEFILLRVKNAVASVALCIEFRSLAVDRELPIIRFLGQSFVWLVDDVNGHLDTVSLTNFEDCSVLHEAPQVVGDRVILLAAGANDQGLSVGFHDVDWDLILLSQR